jgi:ABC-2 type transport system ATP-binding protein
MGSGFDDGPALEVAEVGKSYGATVALRDITLRLEPGEIRALLGPNGAGKTTLVSIIAGLRRPDSGGVRIHGVEVANRPERARRMLGLAPQELGIVPAITVRENLTFMAELHGLRGRALRSRIGEVGEQLLLTPVFDRLGKELSGGEKRRLHTAMALLHRPTLLILDEPTAGADVETRTRLLGLLRGLADEGTAVLYSTHYLPEVETLDAEVSIIDRGRLIASGSVEALIAKHGPGLVEATFDGPRPDGLAGDSASPDGSRVLISSEDLDTTLTEMITSLGSDATRLRSVQLIRPGLEAVFLALTGQRYDVESEPAPQRPGGNDAS